MVLALKLVLEIQTAWRTWQETADASEMDALGAHIDMTLDALVELLEADNEI
jgi:hypothetical protein